MITLNRICADEQMNKWATDFSKSAFPLKNAETTNCSVGSCLIPTTDYRFCAITDDGDWTRITEELDKNKNAEQVLLSVLQDFLVEYTAYISFGRNSFASFNYDKETKSYVAENLSSANDDGDEGSFEKVTYQFQNEKLLKAELENGLFYLKIELSDYGTTVVNVPNDFIEEQ